MDFGMGFLITWVVLAALVAKFGSDRGQRASYVFILSVLLSPLIGLLAVLVSKPQNARTCPHCAESVLPAAKVCKHCKRDIAAATV